MLNAEEIKRVNEVMTACNGDRTKAANILCISRTVLSSYIACSKDLKNLWSKPRVKKEVTAMQAYSGPRLEVVDPETAEEQEKRLDAEFEKLVCGTGTMSGEMIAARALQKAYGHHLNRCMDLMGGSLVDRALKLKKLIDDKEKLIAEGSGTGDMVQAMIYTAELNGYLEMHNVLIKILEVSNKSSLARAKIKQMEGNKEAGKPKGKPGFSPKTQTIVIQEKQTA